MVAQVMRWAGMIGSVVCGYVLVRLQGADWIGGSAVTWGEPEAMLLHTDQLPADAGGFVRFFMVSALPWGPLIAVTAVTAGLRGPSSRLYAALLPVVAGAALAGAASDNVGRRLLNVGDARDVAVLHQTTTVVTVVFAYLGLAAILLLCRLHVVYSAMLVVLYAAVAGFSVAGAAALSRALGTGGPVHPTAAPRTFAIVSVLAVVCALVATVGTALLPRLPRRRPVLVVRAATGAGRAVRDLGQSIAMGLAPRRDVPGYEPWPQLRVLLAAGLAGALMCGGALVLGFGVDPPPVAVPGTPAGPGGSPQPSRSTR
ncbi:hypothetical protein [Dactylosporangium sp. NPDC051541]|uniref:hypothetical protein n=1 Tax=Dactylosporangium sp. NPDC051541 TaxID=3363977 RepID=UPI0037958929